MRRWLPPIACIAIISAMSSTVIGPRAFIRSVSQHSPIAVSEAGFTRFWSEWWWLFVKGFHVLEYAILTFLLLRASRRPILALGIAATFAMLDEFHQTFVPARGGRLSDVGIDLCGVLLGLAINLYLSRRWRKSAR